MNNKRSGKVSDILKYAFLSIILLVLLLLAFKKDLLILITHLSHKNEIRFTKTFLKDFKTKDIENLREYFLKERERNTMRALKFMKMYDKQLQTRIYFIGEFFTVSEYNEKAGKEILRKDLFGFELSTMENGIRLHWIDIFIIKKKNKYYIESFQISEYFPRPPNEIF
jgi:hypothetical protein